MNSSPSLSNLKLVFIGGGQMAAALAGGLLASEWTRERLSVVEPDRDQRAGLQRSLGIEAVASPGPETAEADVIVWAVKPQVLEQAIRGASVFLGHQLHVSIAAGVRSEDIARWVASRRVVRAMPNTAALVGSGVTGMTALDGVEATDKTLVEQILRPTGHCFWVDCDDRLDAVTAVSGSGPAYVFHFMEAYQSAAEAVGFDREQARDLVIKTVTGAVVQAERGGAPFSTLRQNVTSRHGTTEAALAVLEREQTGQALFTAVFAARDRAAEMSREFGSA